MPKPKIKILLAFLALSALLVRPLSAKEVLVYSADTTVLDANRIILDNDNDDTEISLVFGQSLGEYLKHDGTLFHFSDDVRLEEAHRLEFRDTDLAIHSSTDGQLDLDADLTLDLTSPEINLNGNQNLLGHLDLSEITLPADPPANQLRIYAREDSGETKLYYRDEIGNEYQLGYDSAGSSIWTESGSDIYRATGNVGIGAPPPSSADLYLQDTDPVVLLTDDTATTGNLLTFQTKNSDWYAPGWIYRKPITIPYTKVQSSSDLTNFPVLITITADTDLATKAQTDGDDIMFTSADGSTHLPHEIQSYNPTTGALSAWVQIPTLSATSNTSIYLYYGNSTATDQSDPTTLWSEYAGVWHLDSDTNDSTSFARHGTNYGSATTSLGISGSARDFEYNDTTDRIDLGNWSVSGDNLTLQSWVRFESFTQDDARLISKANGIAIQDHVFMLSSISSGGSFYPRSRIKTGLSDSNGTTSLTGSGTGLSTNTWYLLSTTYNGSQIEVSVNGISYGTTSKTDSLRENTWAITLGNNPTLDRPLDGLLDEVRISSTPRSNGWLATEYENLTNPTTFFTLGTEQSPAGSKKWNIGTASASNLSFQTDSADRLTIDTNGQIGINTTLPETTLDVQGGIRPVRLTSDPCGLGYPEGVFFYNDTSDYFCYCDGAGIDRKVSDNTSCF